ncbi:putative pentatricopeptide repeat-containing protein [Acorus calamus]|uniref:Pentatricopeptide repeat-containing protein n=1 Tax=Acorus calamus TaxID=4465 RepID=A0AAV9D1P7_ACOCL|nr:putative pentatricopeptide repeat-containing protein [Acorus calamus]
MTNKQISLRINSGDLAEARRLFEATATERTRVTWTIIIGGYARSARPDDAFDLFNRMLRSGIDPDDLTLASVLCGRDVSPVQVHARVVKTGHASTVLVVNTLIDSYAKCGLFDESRALFDGSRERDSITYNTMIVACHRHGCDERAVDLFHDMRALGLRPTQYTFSGVLFAATALTHIGLARQTHALICDRLDEAETLFQEAPERDCVSYNVMITGYARVGRFVESLRLFRELQFKGFDRSQFPLASVLSVAASRADLGMGRRVHAQAVVTGAPSQITVSNALVDMYAKCGELGSARAIFSMHVDRNEVSWTALLSGYVENGLYEDGVRVFAEMRRAGVATDRVAFASALRASAGASSLPLCEQLHACAVRAGHASGAHVACAVLDAYAKCGRVLEAERAFRDSRERNAVSWNAMVTAYARNGMTEAAVQCFESMVRTVGANEVSFLCVLCACRHGGHVEEGLRWFGRMRGEYGVEARRDHYACVVDMLGRAGRVEEAMRMIREMPFEADEAMWTSVLDACRVHGKRELAEVAANWLLKMDVRDGGTYLTMLDVYARAGEWGEVRRVKGLMRAHGAMKERAYSWLE